MDRICRHGRRHVHGDPRHSDRRQLITRDPGRARARARSIELGADGLSDGRDRRNPADRLADRNAVDARRLSRLRLRLYCRQPRLRRFDRVLVADPGADSARLLRRSADPAGLFGDLPDVRLVGADPGDIGRRPLGDAGADPRAEHRRFRHRPAFLALAVSDQRTDWDRRGAARRLDRRSRPGRSTRLRRGRSLGPAAARDLSRRPRTLAEGGAEARLGQCSDAAAGGSLPHLRRRPGAALSTASGAVDRPRRISRPQFRARLLVQLCSRHRALRGELSAAGVSRLGARLRRVADRRDHDGHRSRPAGGGADRHPARTSHRCAALDRPRVMRCWRSAGSATGL